MNLTISKCGECHYDTNHIQWYGNCTLISDTQATRKRQTKLLDYEDVTLNLEDLK